MSSILTEIDLVCWCRKLAARVVWTAGLFSNKKLSYYMENYPEAKISASQNILPRRSYSPPLMKKLKKSKYYTITWPNTLKDNLVKISVLERRLGNKLT